MRIIIDIANYDSDNEWRIESAVTEAASETLNMLAADGLIDDSNDDAWSFQFPADGEQA